MGDRIWSFEDCPKCGAKDEFECYEQLSSVLKVDSCNKCGHTHSYEIDDTDGINIYINPTYRCCDRKGIK